MNASYDPESDAFYFSGGDGAVTRTIPLGNRTVNVDVDANGKIIGIEVL